MAAGVAGMVAIAVFCYLYGVKFDGNITGFFRIGSELPLSPYLLPDQTRIFQGELGYDGQQFLTIALDPGLGNPDSVAALDHPAYRYRRILYPLLGYCVGVGNPQWIPWALVAINMVAIAVCTGLMGLLLPVASPRWRALWTLVIPGIWMIFSLSTADLLASVWGLGALLSLQRRRWGWLAFCFACGLLTRETLLILWLAVVLTVWKRPHRSAIAALGVSVVPLVGWLGYIHWRQLPGGSGSGNFGWPLVGLGEKFQALISNGVTSSNLYEGFLWGLLIMALAILLWVRGRAIFTPALGDDTELAIAYGSWLYLGLLIVASFYILTYYLNYSRVFLDVFLFNLLVFPNHRWVDRGLFLGCGLASLAFLGLQS